MSEPEFKRHPVEYFGHAFIDDSVEAVQHQESQYCPFLASECRKPRKSEPQTKVGVCTVGYKAQFSQKFEPVVICPYRYRTDYIFEQIANYYFPPDAGYFTKWVPEVSIGLGGSIDYVLAKFKNSSPAEIEDFICVEFQAAGTTGTPWDAVMDFKRSRQFTRDNYNYGINWANEFAKTMMQQVYKKGMIVDSWQKRIVFVLQDVGMAYLRAGAYDTTGLHEPADSQDLIQFYTMKMRWDDSGKEWTLGPDSVLGCDLEGVRKILSGSVSAEYITLEGFIGNINSKLNVT